MNPCSIPKSERENIAPKQEDNNTSHLNHDGEDERLAVECFENMPLGNITDDSPEVHPVCDTLFLRGKHFFEWMYYSLIQGAKQAQDKNIFICQGCLVILTRPPVSCTIQWVQS